MTALMASLLWFPAGYCIRLAYEMIKHDIKRHKRYA